MKRYIITKDYLQLQEVENINKIAELLQCTARQVRKQLIVNKDFVIVNEVKYNVLDRLDY
jgi:transcriptional antiterminator